MTTHPDVPDEFSDLAELLDGEQDFSDRRTPPDPAVRRARRRRGLIITAVVLLLLVTTTGGYAGWALTAPLGEPAATFESPPTPTPDAVQIALPSAGASAISISGADAYLGGEASGIWAASGSNDPRSIASISKLVTALVILEASPLVDGSDPGPMITFSEADHDLYDEYYVLGATIAAMPAGSSMSLRDALATMLIPSASNYAEAVSTWAYGSQAAFLRATRDWLARHGLTGTTIVEPTGIDPRNASTPSDLLAIGKLAAAHPTIAAIAATPVLSLAEPGVLYNTNDLLGSAGITGLKTGNLGEGTYGLLYTAALDAGAAGTLGVTGVMLDGSSRQSLNGDVVALLASIRDGFRRVPLAARGQEVGSYSTPWGSTARAVIADDVAIFTWSDTPILSTMDTTVPATFEPGAQVGTVTWTAGPHTASVPIEIDGSIEPPTAWWRLTNPAELSAPWNG